MDRAAGEAEILSPSSGNGAGRLCFPAGPSRVCGAADMVTDQTSAH